MGTASSEMDRNRSVELEPELHEGDGRVSIWIWIVVAAIIIAGVVFAPFELIWPVG